MALNEPEQGNANCLRSEFLLAHLCSVGFWAHITPL